MQGEETCEVRAVVPRRRLINDLDNKITDERLKNLIYLYKNELIDETSLVNYLKDSNRIIHVFMVDISLLLNPTKSTENLNNNFNGQQPTQPNNPQPPQSPQPNNPQSDYSQANMINSIKSSIESKLKDRLNDSTLDKKSNLFNKTGKYSDFSSEEENFICSYRTCFGDSKYIKKNNEIQEDEVLYLSNSAQKLPNGSCLLKSNSIGLQGCSNCKSNINSLLKDINRID